MLTIEPMPTDPNKLMDTAPHTTFDWSLGTPCKTGTKTVTRAINEYEFIVLTYAIAVGQTAILWLDSNCDHQGTAWARYPSLYQFSRTVTTTQVSTWTDPQHPTDPALYLCKYEWSAESNTSVPFDPVNWLLSPFYNHGRGLSNARQAASGAYRFNVTAVSDGTPWCNSSGSSISGSPSDPIDKCLSYLSDGPCDSLCGVCKYTLPNSVMNTGTYQFGHAIGLVPASGGFSSNIYTMDRGHPVNFGCDLAGCSAGFDCYLNYCRKHCDTNADCGKVGGVDGVTYYPYCNTNQHACYSGNYPSNTAPEMAGGHNSNNDASLTAYMFQLCVTDPNNNTWPKSDQNSICSSYCGADEVGKYGPNNVATCHGFPNASVGTRDGSTTVAQCRVGYGFSQNKTWYFNSDTPGAPQVQQPAYADQYDDGTNNQVFKRDNCDAWMEFTNPTVRKPFWPWDYYTGSGIHYGIDNAADQCGGPGSGQQPVCGPAKPTIYFPKVCGLG